MNGVLNVMCDDLIIGMSFLEAVIGGGGLQVVRVSVDDPRSGLHVMLPPCYDVNVENSKRFYIG